MNSFILVGMLLFMYVERIFQRLCVECAKNLGLLIDHKLNSAIM